MALTALILVRMHLPVVQLEISLRPRASEILSSIFRKLSLRPEPTGRRGLDPPPRHHCRLPAKQASYAILIGFGWP